MEMDRQRLHPLAENMFAWFSSRKAVMVRSVVARLSFALQYST